MKQLYTRWGKSLDSSHVLQEYPRPLLRRDSYVNLNGYWDYAITKTFRRPKEYDGQILVPFSPETALSGVSRQLLPDEYLWYRLRLHAMRQIKPDSTEDEQIRSVQGIDWKKLNAGMHLLLHFGAVDQACRVYVNGNEAARHAGGYLPFYADITGFLRQEKEAGMSGMSGTPEALNEIIVAVKDLSDTSYHAKGKQKLKKGGMFYTAQSGIWQTVWMEYVPEHFIKELRTEPDFQKGLVRIFVRSDVELPIKIQIKEPALGHQLNPVGVQPEHIQWNEMRTDETQTEGMESGEAQGRKGPIITTVSGLSNQEIEIPVPVVRLWTCDEPWLYDFTVTMEDDTVESYFALRSFSVEMDAQEMPRICLNGQVQFQNGVLDQGYWPDGLYTAPSDEALIFDIQEMKKLGFNMLRKHIKIEPQRWYYHCDRLGMAVWQDMVNGGTYYKHWFVTYAATLISWRRWKMADVYTHLLSRTHKEGRLEFVREMKETIRHLQGHPSIAAWVIFNEGWGQFQTADMTEIVRECDKTRLIDQASGWFDQKGGDMQSIHNYFFKLAITPEQERATVLSEFGGYSLQIPEHSACDKLYGYGTHKTLESLNDAYRKQMQKVKELIPQGLCASVYTQLSDVEEEVNGIFTYDREVRKIES